jgi:hypothetical protein
MFVAVFLHELSHSALVWYGRGACNSPQMGGIGGEVGDYMERAFFGGTSCAEFRLDPKRLEAIGLVIDGVFYLLGMSQISMQRCHDALKLEIDEKQAKQLMTFDTSRGLPLLNISTLSPTPLATFGRIRGKINFAASFVTGRSELLIPTVLVGNRIRTSIRNDKKIIMPNA